MLKLCYITDLYAEMISGNGKKNSLRKIQTASVLKVHKALYELQDLCNSYVTFGDKFSYRVPYKTEMIGFDIYGKLLWLEIRVFSNAKIKMFVIDVTDSEIWVNDTTLAMTSEVEILRDRVRVGWKDWFSIA